MKYLIDILLFKRGDKNMPSAQMRQSLAYFRLEYDKGRNHRNRKQFGE